MATNKCPSSDATSSEPHSLVPNTKHFMKQLVGAEDTAVADAATWYSTIDQKILTTQRHLDVNVSSGAVSNNGGGGKRNNPHHPAATRNFLSDSSVQYRRNNTFGFQPKVTLEIPVQYGIRSDFPHLSFQQASRLSIQSSFPLFSSSQSQRRPNHPSTLPHVHQNTTNRSRRRETQSSLMPNDMTCQVSASTSIRGRTGYTSGSINVQSRWEHLNVQTKPRGGDGDKGSVHGISTTTINEKLPIIRQWSTTFHTGIGLSDPNNGRGIDARNKNSKESTTNITTIQQHGNGSVPSATISNAPLPTLRLGVSSNVLHHQSSLSSVSINVQPRFNTPSSSATVQLPVTIANQQQLKVPFTSTCSASKQTTINVRSRFVAVLDYNYNINNINSNNNSLTRLNLPTINTSVTFSPVSLRSSTSRKQISSQNQQSLASNRRNIQDWSVNFGLNKMKDCVYPSIGFSFITIIPNIVQSIWNTPSSTTIVRASNKLLDCSIQWKGGQGWQLNGWWIQQKKNLNQSSSTIKAGPQTSPRRQVGIGVVIHRNLIRNRTTKTSNNNNAMLTSGPFGILSWIFTWTEGDFTVRIPILISAAAESSKCILFHQGFQIFYVSFLSTIIQDIVANFFLPSRVVDDKESDDDRNNYIEAQSQKARQEAIMQQSFMERQAKSRTAVEIAKNGLVIQRAIIYIHLEGSDDRNKISSIDVSMLEEDNKFDVTIPLQFWLSPNESKLVLYGKRSSMLGFYDLATTSGAILPKTLNQHDPAIVSTSTRSINRLWVQYSYEGQSYEITVNNDNDDEGMELPDIQGSKKAIV